MPVKFNKQSEAVLDALYTRFFEAHDGFSEVTSSHWREIGWHRVERRPGSWIMRGAGFGDRAEWTYLNRIRNFGINAALSKMQQRYDCPREIWDMGRAVARLQRRVFSFDCAKQILSLSKVIAEMGGTDPKRPLSSAGLRRVCVIGDGYGYLGVLIKTVDPDVRLTSVNLGRGLLFDAYYSVICMPEASLGLKGEQDVGSCDFVFLPAEDYAELQGMPQDLVFNIASMQEMNLAVVRNYMQYIRHDNEGRPYLYCCNRRAKRLPDGEVVKFEEYGWLDADEIVFDETCPWYQAYPSGIIPRWHPFDGEILHRLVRLAPRCDASTKSQAFFPDKSPNIHRTA